MKITKRNGKEVLFNESKIERAIQRAYSECNTVPSLGYDDIIKPIVGLCEEGISVEDIQQLVIDRLTDIDPKVAIAYAEYRTRQNIAREKGWDLSELGQRIYEEKYRNNNETFDEFLDRVSNGNNDIRKRIKNKQFLFGGRILASRGVKERKVTYSNCYVLPSPEDNLESIFDTAKEMARTFSYGGGCGVDISKLRPTGMRVNNSAMHTTGAVSFMELYAETTKLIGQKGRRGALMISIDVSHPDIIRFIKAKSDNESITSANISVKITDEFMKAVEDDTEYELSFTCKDTNETHMELVKARTVFSLLCANNYNYAEPGILFWDRTNNHHLMSAVPGYKFTTTNPCGELPLMDYGACLLGSINLAEFVTNPFTEHADFDGNAFCDTVRDAVIALDEVIEENVLLHPLQGQQDYAREYRPMGLGVMGIADMLIKMGMQYGDDMSINLCKKIAYTMQQQALMASAELAKNKGAFPKYNFDYISESEFFKKNVNPAVQDIIKEHGLRNAQLLSIAPTGSISNMLGISGGIEPIFQTSYTRKVESFGDSDEYFTVYTPVIKEAIDKLDVDESYFKTAMNLDPFKRIAMQSVWQEYVDNSISSTVNLPESASVQDIKDIYMEAWKKGLKGVTIYRDNCLRGAILTTSKSEKKQVKETKACAS